MTLTGRNFKSKLKESYKDFDGEAINSYVKGWLNHTDGDFETISDLLRDLNDYLLKGLHDIVILEAESYSNQGWVTPNIQKAYLNEDGRIWIELGADQIFEDFEMCKDEGFDFTKDNDLIQFCKELGSVIVHEMVHLYQFTKYQDRSVSNTSSDYFEYLMSKDEIDAHAISAVEEARSLGYADKDILRKLSHNAKDLILELDSITPYVDFYRSDYKKDQDVIKRLLKKMTDYVLDSKMNEKEIRKTANLREDKHQKMVNDYDIDLIKTRLKESSDPAEKIIDILKTEYDLVSTKEEGRNAVHVETDVGNFEVLYYSDAIYVLRVDSNSFNFEKEYDSPRKVCKVINDLIDAEVEDVVF